MPHFWSALRTKPDTHAREGKATQKIASVGCTFHPSLHDTVDETVGLLEEVAGHILAKGA